MFQFWLKRPSEHKKLHALKKQEHNIRVATKWYKKSKVLKELFKIISVVLNIRTEFKK